MIRGGVSQSPKITGITASPAEPTPGTQVTLSVTAASPDGGTLSYQWYTVNDGKNIPVSGATKNPYSYKIPADTPDGRKVTFCAQVTNTVSGKEPASALSGNASVTVKKKAPTSAETPTVTVTSNGGIADIGAACGAAVTFSVSASVSDGGTLSYKWEKEEDGVWTVTDGSKNYYSFSTPSTVGWESVKYRITVTNTLTLADGKTFSAHTVQEFSVKEDSRPEMPAPKISFKMHSNSVDTDINVYQWTDETPPRFVAEVFVDENFTLSASVSDTDGNPVEGIVSWEWKLPSWMHGDIKTDESGTSYTDVFTDDSESAADNVDIFVTVSDPDGNRRPSQRRERFYIRSVPHSKILFDAGHGAFSDGEKTKVMPIPLSILRDVKNNGSGSGAGKYLSFGREDFCQWMKDIGMHKDVINNGSDGIGMTCGSIEFDDWMIDTVKKWSDEERLIGLAGFEMLTFEAKWLRDMGLLEKVNKLFIAAIPGLVNRSGMSGNWTQRLEAYKAEYVGNRLNIYYDIELKNIEESENVLSDNKTVGFTVTANGNELTVPKKNSDILETGSSYISIYLDKTGCGIEENEKTLFYDKESHDFIRFVPVRNYTAASDDDVAVWYTGPDVYNAQFEHDYTLKRYNDSPVGYFAHRLEVGHSYRIRFCLYLDETEQIYGVNDFSWSDTTDPSATACMFFPCYALETVTLFSMAKEYDMPYQRGTVTTKKTDAGKAKALDVSVELPWRMDRNVNTNEDECYFSYYGEATKMYQSVSKAKVKISPLQGDSKLPDGCTLEFYRGNPSQGMISQRIVSSSSYDSILKNYSYNPPEERGGCYEVALPDFNSVADFGPYCIRVSNSVSYFDENGYEKTDTAYTVVEFQFGKKVEYDPFEWFMPEKYRYHYHFDFETQKVFVFYRQTIRSLCSSYSIGGFYWGNFGSGFHMPNEEAENIVQLQKMKLRAVGTDGTKLSATNEKSVLYNSFEGDNVFTLQGRASSSAFKNDIYEKLLYKQKPGSLVLSEAEKPAGALGYGLKVTPGKCYSVLLRADLTEFPPCFEVLSLE